MIQKVKVLKEVLVINNVDKETVFGVIGRMRVLIDFFQTRQEFRNLLPFLKTYYYVTKTVAEKRLKTPNYYQDHDSLNRLDVYFASLYFNPLRKYLAGQPVPSPWKTYFNYCRARQGVPFLQMLLGINAHINGDLCQALVKTNYHNRKDFLIIDRILEEEIPYVMKFLALEYKDLFGWGGLIAKNLVEGEFRRIIVSWRKDAWGNSLALRSHSQLSQSRDIKHQTETASKSLIKIFESISHPTHWPRIRKELYKISVSI